MTVKKIKAYKTSDGNIHENINVANKVEGRLTLETELRDAFGFIGETTDHEEMIFEGIMEHKEKIYMALRKYYTGK